MEAPPRTSMNSRRFMATPSRAEVNFFDGWNDSTRGFAAWEIIRGAPAAAVAGVPERSNV